MTKKVSLSDLTGKHVLDFAAMESSIVENGEDCNVVSWGMDGCTFVAVEDPDDGYRSYLSCISRHTGKHQSINGAAPIGRPVTIRHLDEYNKDMIEIIDVSTGHLWARIGTDNTDDYYPYCVLEWNPMTPA